MHYQFSTALASELGDARAYACDVSDGGAVNDALAKVATDLGEVDTLVYNAGSVVWGSIEDISPEQFETSWRINTAGLFHAAKR